jgi:hypothetical protein
MNWYTLHFGQTTNIMEKSVLDVLQENITTIDQKSKDTSKPIHFLIDNYPERLQRLVFEPSPDLPGEFDIIDTLNKDPQRRLFSKSTKHALYDAMIIALRLYFLITGSTGSTPFTN